MRRSRPHRISIISRVGIAVLAGLGFWHVIPAGGQALTITGLSPSSTVAGGPAFTLTVNGMNFASDSVVRWNGSNRTTSVVNSTQLAASIPSSDIAASGTATITVFNPSDGSTSNGLTFTINAPVPAIIGLVPNSRPAGGSSFTLTVSGTNFIANSVIRWNGADRPTAFFSSITIEATIPASDVATAGTAEITVFNPSPGGGGSNILLFTITTTNPPPTITGISPTSAVAGSTGFNLTVSGTNFSGASVVQWNGSGRTTSFINSATLTAEIPASDIALPGTVSITVRDTSPGGGTSNALTFNIEVFFNEFFSQVAVGGGFSTEFSLVNTSGSTVSGNLFLTDQGGNPLVVNLNEPGATEEAGSPDGRFTVASASFPVVIASGGTKVVSASPLNPGDSTRSGWARFESTVGTVSGVATFLLRDGGTLKSIAGVLGSPPVEFATILVYNDDSRNRFTGFAVANHNNENINIKIVTLSENGSVLDIISPAELNPLGPRRHVARFLHEYLPLRLKLKGSMVLMVQAGRKCVTTALVMNEGLLTAIPVIREKAPGIPN